MKKFFVSDKSIDPRDLLLEEGKEFFEKYGVVIRKKDIHLNGRSKWKSDLGDTIDSKTIEQIKEFFEELSDVVDNLDVLETAEAGDLKNLMKKFLK